MKISIPLPFYRVKSGQSIAEPNKCPWWHKVFRHNWEYEDGNGFTSYYICRCGARMAKQREGERQPVDWNWLLGKTQKL